MRTLAEAVRAGRLRPGERLPGSRTLAAELGVHRNTVLTAYDELIAEGWVEARQGQGTFVSAALPDARERAARKTAPGAAERVGFPLAPAPPGREPGAWPTGDLLDLSRGTPDVRLVPSAAIARAHRRALRRHPELLDYGDPQGHSRLRAVAVLADMLRATRGLHGDGRRVIVTRGSQMALHLAARAVVRPGDTVAVDALGYPPAWRAPRAAGARLVPVPVDAGGLLVERLAELCRRRPVRAVYLTPHHQYPTTAVLAPARRLALLALARRHRIAILEDDYDNEFHYRGRPILPLASADRAGSVVYLGSLSKVLAPSLRLGYLVGPPELVERAVSWRRCVDGQGDTVAEYALAELIDDGELARHARRMRRVYEARREVLADALRRRLGPRVSFHLPPGGMALWVRVDRRVDVERWAARCLERGVCIRTARHFAFDRRSRPFVRLGFAALDEAELGRGVAIMTGALPQS